MTELMPLFMFLVAGLILMTGYPVAFALAGTALIFSLIGSLTGGFRKITVTSGIDAGAASSPLLQTPDSVISG